MGSCIYEFELRYMTKEDQELGLKILRRLLLQFIAAHEFWQRNRGANAVPKARDEFFFHVKRLFPDVHEHLVSAYEGYLSDCNNWLAGKISVGGVLDVEDQLNLFDPFWVGYSAEVSHLADWGPMVSFLRVRSGAIMSRWRSEEQPSWLRGDP